MRAAVVNKSEYEIKSMKPILAFKDSEPLGSGTFRGGVKSLLEDDKAKRGDLINLTVLLQDVSATL
jgi:hypothetical protein